MAAVSRKNSRSEIYTPPFTILIDSQEQHPWSFLGLQTDLKHGRVCPESGQRIPRSIIPHTRRQHLGKGQGDYKIEGMEDVFSIERKSLADFQSTLLGYGDGHRDRFERELETLSGMKRAFVVIEGSYEPFLAQAPEWGDRSREENAKNLFRSDISLSLRYGIPFRFFDTRQLAEIWAFRTMEKFYEYEMKGAR